MERTEAKRDWTCFATVNQYFACRGTSAAREKASVRVAEVKIPEHFSVELEKAGLIASNGMVVARTWPQHCNLIEPPPGTAWHLLQGRRQGLARSAATADVGRRVIVHHAQCLRQALHVTGPSAIAVDPLLEVEAIVGLELGRY